MVFKFLGFEVRTMEVNLEAQLLDREGVRHGKAEWKRYSDGGKKMKLRFDSLAEADGASLGVFIDGRESGRVTVNGGWGRLKVRSEEGDGEVVPAAFVGEAIEIRDGERVLLRGVFEDD